MIKAKQLREHLSQCLPTVPADKMLMYIKNGSLLTAGRDGIDQCAGYTIKYAVELVLIDYADEPDLVFDAVMQFVQTQQAEYATNTALAADFVTFGAEVVNANCYDLLLTIKLSEDVSITQSPGKDGHNVRSYTHHAHPVDPDDQEAELFLLYGTPDGVRLL